MKPTRTSTLTVVAVVCAVAAWLLLHSVYEKLPPLPWTGVPALLVAALAEAWTGRDLKARIAGRRGLKPAAPLFVSRMVALAKASSLAGAAIAGLAAGLVIYLSGSLNTPVPRQDAVTAAITLAAAVLLACAALYLENCCRVPNAPDPDRADEGAHLP
jgi:peptidoglycan/LPS O-acetylase OafA/YrhL